MFKPHVFGYVNPRCSGLKITRRDAVKWRQTISACAQNVNENGGRTCGVDALEGLEDIFFRSTRIIRSISDSLFKLIWYGPDNPCLAKKNTNN